MAFSPSARTTSLLAGRTALALLKAPAFMPCNAYG
jgi:hypothetical protein